MFTCVLKQEAGRDCEGMCGMGRRDKVKFNIGICQSRRYSHNSCSIEKEAPNYPSCLLTYRDERMLRVRFSREEFSLLKTRSRRLPLTISYIRICRILLIVQAGRGKVLYGIQDDAARRHFSFSCRVGSAFYLCLG